MIKKSAWLIAASITGNGRLDCRTEQDGVTLIEIAVAYGLILLVIWTPRPMAKVFWWFAAVAGSSSSPALSFDGLKAMGLRSGELLAFVVDSVARAG